MDEPLSEREIEILHLLADGSANGEIAAKLSLSLHTVKWYTRRIYEKLDVENRTQAVQRAQTLGLLNGSSEPKQTAPQPPSNLPAPLTTLVGRRNEITAVKQLLKQHRLVTLTGPGGVGKTRLSLRVAEEVNSFFKDGIYFFDLAAINEATLVINTLAYVLGVAESLDTPLLTLTQAALRHKQLLLVLDNFEHLLDAAPVVADLLATAPELRVLITSREVLALYGEQEYVVPPLQLPDLEWFATQHLPFAELLRSEALQLFERCAQAVLPTFRLTAENVSAVASICLRLDGLPLAIELAAAYSKLLTPQAMLAQLDSLWLEMKRPLRNIPTRQQTLRNTIEWSYRLLSDDEQQLFAQLSIFRGGCTLDAIIAICRHNSMVALLEQVNGLVNKSLLWCRVDATGEPRFGMLETIREFAANCLQTLGGVEALRQRHAHYYAQFSTQVSAAIMSINQPQVRYELGREWDNFRLALRWSTEVDPEPGFRILRMIGDLAVCWRIRDYLAEGLEWAEQLLTTPQPSSQLVQARAYASIAILAYVLGRWQQARQLAEQACRIAPPDVDPYTRALALHAWVNTHIAPNLTPEEYAEIDLLGNESARLYTQAGDQLGYARVVNMLGEAMRIQQRYVEAKRYYEESHQAVHAVGYPSGESLIQGNLGWTLLRLGQPAEALVHFRASAILAQEINFVYGVGVALIGVAAALAHVGQAQPAARVLGAADTILESVGIVMQPADEPDYHWMRTELQTQLGPTDFEQCLLAGRTLTAAQAIALATEVCTL